MIELPQTNFRKRISANEFPQTNNEGPKPLPCFATLLWSNPLITLSIALIIPAH